MDELTPNPSNQVPIPSFEKLDWLRQMVRALGGTADEKVCRPTPLAYPDPDGQKTHMANTQACGLPAHVSVPFEGDNGVQATVCLVCDGVAAWPRFSDDDLPSPEGDTIPA